MYTSIIENISKGELCALLPRTMFYFYVLTFKMVSVLLSSVVDRVFEPRLNSFLSGSYYLLAVYAVTGHCV